MSLNILKILYVEMRLKKIINICYENLERKTNNYELGIRVHFVQWKKILRISKSILKNIFIILYKIYIMFFSSHIV